MSEQAELFPGFDSSVAVDALNRSMPFEADVAWLFESATGLEPNEFMDGSFFRLGWTGAEDKREEEIGRCVRLLLELFVSNSAFAAEISVRDSMPHERIDREVRRFIGSKR